MHGAKLEKGDRAEANSGYFPGKQRNSLFNHKRTYRNIQCSKKAQQANRKEANPPENK